MLECCKGIKYDLAFEGMGLWNFKPILQHSKHGKDPSFVCMNFLPFGVFELGYVNLCLRDMALYWKYERDKQDMEKLSLWILFKNVEMVESMAHFVQEDMNDKLGLTYLLTCTPKAQIYSVPLSKLHYSHLMV